MNITGGKDDPSQVRAFNALFESMQTGQGLTPEVYQQIINLWNKVDEDSNGTLEEAEAKVFLASLYKSITSPPFNWKPKLSSQKETVQTWFEFFDADGNGCLSRKEFLEGISVFGGSHDILDTIERSREGSLTKSGKPKRPVRTSPKPLPDQLHSWANSVLHADELAAMIPTDSTIHDLEKWKAEKGYKLVLCCDGGGLRGNATVAFMMELEKALGHPLYKIFDMMSGTSTGAINVAVMGGLGKPASDIFNAYTPENLKRIFPTVTGLHTGLALKAPKYNGVGKRRILGNFISGTIDQSVIPLVIPTYDICRREAWCWTPEHVGVPLLDIVDAATAAPTFFPACKVGASWHCDGVVVANDPSLCAYVEAMAKWPGEQIRVVSIGTGIMQSPIDGEKCQKHGVIGWFTKGGFLDMVMDNTLSQKMVSALLKSNYIRVNSYLLPAGCNEEMDDRSPDNITALRNLGLLWWRAFGARTLDIITKTTLADVLGGGSLGHALSSHVTIQNPSTPKEGSSKGSRDRKITGSSVPATPKATPPSATPPTPKAIPAITTPPSASPPLASPASSKPELERRGRSLKLEVETESPSDSPVPHRLVPLGALTASNADNNSRKRTISASPGAPYLKKNITEGERKQLVEELCSLAFEGNLETLTEILNHQPQLLNSQNSRGQTPLYCASHSGNSPILVHLLNQKTIDVNLQTPTHGGSALHAASFNGHPEAVALLLKRDANIDLANNKGLTPKQEAKGLTVDVYSYFATDQKKLAAIYPVVLQLKKLNMKTTM